MTRAAVLVLCAPMVAHAHGLRAEIETPGEKVAVRCFYDGGEPAEAGVTVYAPDEPDAVFQELKTDEHGRVEFVPDGPGSWRVVADDGLGHRVELEVAVSEGGSVQVMPPEAVWLHARNGLLVALAAVVAVWLARRRGGGR